MPNRVSVIIPSWRERDLEKKVNSLAETFSTTPDAQVIAVWSGDGPAEGSWRIGSCSVRIVRNPDAGSRAGNMNLGARVATGDVLVFLHADSSLPPEAPSALARLDVAKHPYGAFPKRFVPETALLRISARWTNARMLRRWDFLGDNAPFIARAWFDAVGGFPDQPLFEDVELARALRRKALLEGRRPHFPDAATVTSSRKFLRRGALLTTAFMQAVRAAYAVGIPVERIAAAYRKW